MDDLDAYVKLIRARRLYESTEKKPDFHICHLVPLKTDNVVGLTNSRNCIIGLAEVNQGLGNKAVFTQAEHGKNYLFKEDLAKRWLVNPNDVEKVKKLLPDYFGPELSEWCRRMSFTPRDSGSVWDRPHQNREQLFPIMYEALHQEASTIEVAHLFDIAAAWTDFANQYADNYKPGWADNIARDTQLEKAGEALQMYLFTGSVEFAAEAHEIIVEATEERYRQG
jgi:hypothetical protein